MTSISHCVKSNNVEDVREMESLLWLPDYLATTEIEKKYKYVSNLAEGENGYWCKENDWNKAMEEYLKGRRRPFKDIIILP